MTKTLRILALIAVGLTAGLHYYIAWLEIFAWTSRGPKVFDTLPVSLFPQTIELAANQGLYNGFLAIGLTWAMFITDRVWQFRISICFLLFVMIAGIGAAVTIDLGTGLPQMMTSIVALALLFCWKASKQTPPMGQN